jgi:double-stranded uracil-DNA glycosylase
MQATGFAPVAAADARVLILGSLPGAVSLARGEYYAQPRNAFWPVMGAFVGAAPSLPYARRLERLTTNGIALWDVCASGFRPGSLDSAIALSSVVPNDFAAFFRDHPGIGLVCCNGGTAAELFRRLVLPGLPAEARAVRRLVLPSTSPAHAAMPFAEKLRRWGDGLVQSGVVPAGAAVADRPDRFR